MVHWHGDWPAVSPRKGPERLCMAMAQATQQWWRGSCLIFSSKPLPDVASDHKTLTDSEFPEKGEFPQRKNENTHAFKSFQTDSGKKKITFYNGRPPWCVFKLHRHLFLSSAAAVGMTKVDSPQWLNLISSLIKRKATTGEAAISVSKQQDTDISSSCLMEQEIIVLLLLSWPSSLYVQTHIYIKKLL